MNSVDYVTAKLNATTFTEADKTDAEIVKYTRDLASSLKNLHDQNVVHRDIRLQTVIKTNGVYELTKSEDLATDRQAKKVAAVFGRLDSVAPERMNRRHRYLGSWKPDDVYALGCVFYKTILAEDVPWASWEEWEKVQLEKESFRHCSSVAKNVMATPQLLNITLHFVTLWMLHPDPKERPDIAVVCEKLGQIFPSHLPVIAPLECQVKQNLVFDISNVERCATFVLELLKSSGAQSGYAYLPRKKTGSNFQIIGSVEKNWVLLLPENKESQLKEFAPADPHASASLVENGTFKVGRRATVLEKVGEVWVAKNYFALSSRKRQAPYCFKGAYAKEMWLDERLGDSKLFPKHKMSFSYGNKSHKRLSLYEAFSQCLFDQPAAAFELSHAHELALNLLKLHKLGFVHRDIKNENILVSEDGSFAFCDVDTVVLDEQWKEIRENVGTEDGRAPERYTKYTGSWFPDDVYGLGCVFFEKYYNCRPAWADCSSEEMAKRKNNVLKDSIEAKQCLQADFSEFARQDPEDCGICLILWMLHPDPKERPTMQEVCDVIEQIILVTSRQGRHNHSLE